MPLLYRYNLQRSFVSPALVSIRKYRMRHLRFPIRKGGIFRPGKETEGWRGGVHAYAAQADPKIDAVRAEKDRFRMETRWLKHNLYP